MHRLLIIQTAFIGDVILATPVVEKLHRFFPDSRIDFLLRKGNEGLLDNHPLVDEVIVWDKQAAKYRNLAKTISTVRNRRYDLVVNLQRFFSSGLVTVLSNAKETVGFDKNPLANFFSRKIAHRIGSKEHPSHEIERNLSLIAHLTDDSIVQPKLYPSAQDFEEVRQKDHYICIAPTSVWFTKQLPAKKWVELMDAQEEELKIILLGGKADFDACQYILNTSVHKKIENLAGQLTFLQSAALMKDARMNYVNDSAPLHIASAMNAPVTAVFCSTIPEFGFGPLSDDQQIIEVTEKLECRPCGLHGYKSCPEGHFKCAEVQFPIFSPQDKMK